MKSLSANHQLPSPMGSDKAGADADGADDLPLLHGVQQGEAGADMGATSDLSFLNGVAFHPVAASQ